jgi:uncharacterized delta-60 repeat protein
MSKLLLLGLFVLGGAVNAQPPGTLDLTFNPGDAGNFTGDGAFGGAVQAVVVQPDGKFLIGGRFNAYNEVRTSKVGRVNASGTADATFQAWPGCNGQVHALARQSDGNVLLAGYFSAYDEVPRSNIARTNTDGSLDTSFDTGTGFAMGSDNFPYINAMVVQADGKVLVAGNFGGYNGTSRNNIARLLANGELDLSFNPGTGTDGSIHTMQVLANGDVLIGGNFNTYNGIARRSIARLNTDGSLDTGFNPGSGASGTVECILVRTNGSLYIGGTFGTYNNVPRTNFARIQANGTLDNGFPSIDLLPLSQVLSISEEPSGALWIGGGLIQQFLLRVTATGEIDQGTALGAGPNGTVHQIVRLTSGSTLIVGNFTAFNGVTTFGLALLNPDGSLQQPFSAGSGFNNNRVMELLRRPDGRIMTRGAFKGYNGIPQYGLASLLPNGELDNTFNAGLGATQINAMALRTDGRLLIGGAFTTFNGLPSSRIVQLLANGALDNSFTCNVNGIISDIVLEPSGNVLIMGAFTQVNGMARNRIARLLPNGTLDASFDPGLGADQTISTAHLLSDGRMLIAGLFTSYGGVARGRIARLNANGTLDTTFDPGQGANGLIRHITVLPDQRILIGSNFTTYNGVARRYIARLQPDGALDLTFNAMVDGSNPSQVIPLNDGRLIVVGGAGMSFNGVLRNGIACLLPNGALDPTFDAGSGTDRTVESAILVDDDMLLIAGDFGNYNGIGRNRIARINIGSAPTLAVRPRVFLDGPFETTSSLMVDQLRADQLLPLSEPYTALAYTHLGGGGEQTTTPVLAVTDNNAIVDWVVVELRGTSAPHPVIATRSALVQRDGDVVDVDGTSPVGFSLPAANYHIAIRHRNHLGVMTASPIALSATATTIDFTNASTPTWGTDARKNNNGTMTLWPGDTNFDGQVKYAGPANDRDVVLTTVGGSTPTNTVNTIYSGADVNMDGVVKYAGANNDRDIILQTIGGTVPTAVRVQQLP